ncbi:protein let-653-like [Larimichthys crocea]|uniref:protein let-653-like n=1 Tax=Larimichthys crocea TaxID=215358 RepID=UPI000F5E9463|nr:protein let-653-like [Larimichthys crocea]
MKLGLLVVLAVAVLVPSLSESRIISRCELKEKLGEALEGYLPWGLRRFKERIVKIVVCKLMRMSNLDTGLVKVRGKRRTRPTPVVTTRATTTRPTTTTTTTETTTTRPTTTEATTTTTTPETTTTRPTTTEATTTTTTTETTTRPTTTEATTTTTTTAETTTRPTTTEATTTTTTTAETTTRPTTTEATTTTTTTAETTTRPTTTEATTTRPTTDEATTTTEATAPESGAPRSTLEPNQTATELGKRRRKRGADSSQSDEPNELESSLEEILNQEENLFDEEEMEQDDNRTDSDEESSEQGSVESGQRKKRFVPRWKPKRRRTWSLGYYGLFQLSDSHFCDSGYRWSHNRCQTSCSAFTDDDITDDIKCFVETGYWWHVLTRRPFQSCHFYAHHLFRQCT